MKSNLKNIILIFIFIILIIVIYDILNYSTNEKIERLKDHKYTNLSMNMQKEFNQLIDVKRNTTLAIALLLAKNNYFIDALVKNKDFNLDLDSYSGILKEHSDFKNIWFQIVNKDGVSIARSWTKKRGDNVLKQRIDLQRVFQTKKASTSISIGKFDLTFKASVPIFYNNKIVGIFESISHLNSITNELIKKDIFPVIVAEEKYKKQLIDPFSKIFIGDNYIANINAKEKQLEVIRRIGVPFFKNLSDPYIIDKKTKQLITVVKMYDINNQAMSYAILFKPLEKIDISQITQLKTNMNFYIILLVLIIVIFIYYFVIQKYNNFLKEEHKRLKLILDTQPNIMLITNTKTIVEVNSKFLEFFNKYSSLDHFLSEYNCICYLFEDFDDEDYIKDKIVENKKWIEYLIDNSHKILKVAMKKDGELHHFIIKASKIDSNKFSDEFFTVIVLVDITSEIKIKKEIEYKNKLINEQSKMVAMGEMIGNIAHQWRQPLSIITTAVTSMQLEKEFNRLSDEKFNKNCDLINKNAQYLSKTIDDFKNFIKGDRSKRITKVSSIIESFLNLVEAAAKNNNIEIILNVDNNIDLNGYENELIQCFINIFNNSKDAFKENNIKDRFIFIDSYILNDRLIIKIKDNALGIPENIISKIFDPYFTTKHQSQGTGLGLNMTYKLITEGMDGSILVNNKRFKYKEQEYKGAEFTISLPLN